MNSVLIGNDHALSTFINPIKYLRIAQINHQVQTIIQFIMVLFYINGVSILI